MEQCENKRIIELIQEGRVLQSGLAAFQDRVGERAAIYSFKQHNVLLLSFACQ